MEAVCSSIIISPGNATAATVLSKMYHKTILHILHIVLHFDVRYPLESVAICEGYQTRPRGVISVALGPAAVHRCAYRADVLSTTNTAEMCRVSFLRSLKSFSRSLFSHRPPPSTEEGIRGPEDDDRWGGSYQICIKSLWSDSHIGQITL